MLDPPISCTSRSRRVARSRRAKIDDDEDQEEGADRGQDGQDHVVEPALQAGLFDHLDLHRRVLGIGLGGLCFEALGDVFDHALQVRHHLVVGPGIEKRVDLGQDVALILRQVHPDLADLVGKDQDEGGHHHGSRQHGHDHRRHVAHPKAAQLCHQRAEDERKEHPQRQGQEQVLRDVEDGADDRDGGQRGQRDDGVAFLDRQCRRAASSVRVDGVVHDVPRCTVPRGKRIVGQSVPCAGTDWDAPPEGVSGGAESQAAARLMPVSAMPDSALSAAYSWSSTRFSSVAASFRPSALAKATSEP